MELKFRTLKANEIDCRVSQIASNWLTLLLYKDARADMDVLDETVEPMHWKREHLRENANCKVSIYDSDTKEWVSKEDTGTESFSEAEKGLASDSFKRACVNWGIGRELYTAPSIFILPNKDMIPKGKDNEFYQNDKGKYETKTRFWVEYIDYNNDREIQNLIIRDNKNHIRFSKLTKEKEGELLKLQKELKTLIEKTEENDSKFDRERFYQYYGATGDNTLLYEQVKDGIEKLSKVKEKK
jgi:hypothetical protein